MPLGIMQRLLLAKGLRGFGDGFVSLLLPLHLVSLGLSALQIGVIATTTLLGSGLLTLLVGTQAGRIPYRTLLLAATALMGATGVALAGLEGFWLLLLVALIGTISPSGGDVSVFMPLEHALLARSIDDRDRTAAFARYSLVGTLSAAFGALAAGLPAIVAQATGVPMPRAIQAMFLLYALIAAITSLVYRTLPRRSSEAVQQEPRSVLGPARKRVLLLAGLFSLDAFGGGFVVQSLLALWLYQRFGLSLETAAAIFFWSGVLTAVSYLLAVPLARRIGLVRTMVYTHLPSSLCLLVIPFCPELSWAVALLLVRSALSQMDVPTRSSYVMAIVTPSERPAAASLTAVPRSMAAALSPTLAGYLLGLSSFGWPLIAGGALKIVYDLLLLSLFRGVRPPEEQAPPADRPSGSGGDPHPGVRPEAHP